MNGKRRIIGLMVLVGLTGLTGCLVGGSSEVRREGTYVADTTLGNIEPGKTQTSWVLATLGQPSEKTQIDPNRELWKYCYKETRNSSGFVFLIFGGSDSKVTDGRVFIEFQDGVVTKTWRG
ncbi:MAG TPA: outer membrane protein assembly factor BamE [Tepidisphaeraceae bacterium]|jgi:outer membrane protein assembly factor BamE (lipoprotein component of BamABCDE complex)